MRSVLLWLLHPPHGSDVRRLTAFVLFAIALPRLPGWPGPFVVYPLGIFSGEVFGWLAFFVGLALLVTGRSLRLRFVGRLAAVLAFALWVTLAFATSSATSMLLDVVFALAMLGEITAQRRDYQ